MQSASSSILLFSHVQPGYSIFPLGEEMTSLEFDTLAIDAVLHHRLMAMKTWIEKRAFAGFRDIVIGYRSITISFNFYQLASVVDGRAFEFVSQILESAYQNTSGESKSPIGNEIRIPVCYDDEFGLDLDVVAKHSQLTKSGIINLHTSRSYTVYMVGFLPGFPYMGLVPDQLEVPRRDTPRNLVPSGSVGLAGRQTGIYPLNSPGGWQIIGRTPLKIFDAKRDPPVLFQPGDVISFYKITRKEFDHLQNNSR